MGSYCLHKAAEGKIYLFRYPMHPTSHTAPILLLLSHVQLFATPWTAARQASLSFTISQSVLKLMSIESVMSFNHHILCRPLLLLPSIFPSIRVFFKESVIYIRWPKYWSFSFSISPSNEYSGLIPLGWIGWIILQSMGLSRVFSNTTVQKHQFFSVQLSLWPNSHIHTWLLEKSLLLTLQTFVGKVMTLLFNMLMRLVITFLPRSKQLLIFWLQSPSAVILEHKKIKSVTVSIVSPSICHEVMGSDTMILIFWMLSFKPAFHSPLSSSSRGSLILFAFCHKGGVICISKVVAILPSNLLFLNHQATVVYLLYCF